MIRIKKECEMELENEVKVSVSFCLRFLDELS